MVLIFTFKARLCKRKVPDLADVGRANFPAGFTTSRGKLRYLPPLECWGELRHRFNHVSSHGAVTLPCHVHWCAGSIQCRWKMYVTCKQDPSLHFEADSSGTLSAVRSHASRHRCCTPSTLFTLYYLHCMQSVCLCHA